MEAKFVGVDVSKAMLEVDSLPLSQSQQFPNDEKGIATLVRLLKGSDTQRIALEATGGYETALAVALAAAGLPVVVVNPQRVRDLAKASGILANTDRLDARVLAAFGQAVVPPIRALPDEAQRDLAELLDRRMQRVTLRAQEKARLSTVLPVAKRNIEEHITWLDKQIDKLDKDLTTRWHKSQVWKDKVEWLKSVPGIGQAA